MEKVFLPNEIESKRIVLRRHSLELADQMFRYVDQDRKRLREFLPWVDSTRTINDEISYIRMTQEKWDHHSLFDYGIYRIEDSLYMGNCGVHSIAWENDRCELGYWILGAFEGQGFMSESVRALEKILFEVGFNRVEIHCSSLNLRSANIPQANAYRLEGIQKQDVIENGKYRDTFIFAKLRSEYQNRHAKPHPLLGLDHTRLSVKDLVASKEWYSKALGVSPWLDTENYVEFRTGQSSLALAPVDEKSPFSKGGQVAYWRVHELESGITHFVSQGAKVYRGPLDIDNGEAICQIEDPFGNIFGLIGKDFTAKATMKVQP